MCSDHKAKLVTVAEHWLSKEDGNFHTIPGYELASFYGRKNSIRGGAAIFVINDLEFKELSIVKELSLEMVCEAAAIELPNEKIIVISLYRPYNTDVNYFKNFLVCLNNILCAVYKCNFNIIVCADFNVNFNLNDNFKRDLCNLFECFGLHITTNEITRPGLLNDGNCIDNVVTDIHISRCETQVINTHLSDHHALVFKPVIHVKRTSKYSKCK